MTLSISTLKPTWLEFKSSFQFNDFQKSYANNWECPESLEHVIKTLLLNYNKNNMLMSYCGVALTMYYNNSNPNLLEFSIIAKAMTESKIAGKELCPKRFACVNNGYMKCPENVICPL